MQERIPAQNIEAEQAVLSAILIDNNVMEKIEEILKPSDFYRIVHQIIYQSMLDMHAKHQPIDMITLIEELKNRPGVTFRSNTTKDGLVGTFEHAPAMVFTVKLPVNDEV